MALQLEPAEHLLLIVAMEQAEAEIPAALELMVVRQVLLLVMFLEEEEVLVLAVQTTAVAVKAAQD